MEKQWKIDGTAERVTITRRERSNPNKGWVTHDPMAATGPKAKECFDLYNGAQALGKWVSTAPEAQS